MDKIKLKVVILTNNQPRHYYFIKKMNQSFDILGLITEPHHDYFNKQQKQSKLIRHHFNDLKNNEQRYFNTDTGYIKNHRQIKAKEINKKENVEWIKSLNPDYILLYGTGILNKFWFREFNDRIINLHLGMSPHYRGSATLFWPFYNEELEYLGITIHLATEEVDGGDILHVVKPDIESKDNYYDITNKLIKKSINEFSNVIYEYDNGNKKRIPQDISKQKYLYKKKDFSEEALNKVLNKFRIANAINS
jgi:methionyl-tRNA formyltransferase